MRAAAPGLMLVAGLLLPAMLGCSDSPAPVAETPRAIEADPADDADLADEADSSSVQVATLGSTAPVSQSGDIYLAGQPTVEDIALMKAKGIKTVVSLRKEDETDWNEEKIVEAAGMEFVRIPFGGADELNAEIFDQVRALLRDSESQPVVLHCGSANRVGAVWLPYRVLDQGTPLDEAVREARQVGLESEDLERKARAYVRRKQAAEPDGAEAEGASAEAESAEAESAAGEAAESGESDAVESVDDDAAVAE